MDYRPNADPTKPPQPVATEDERIAFAAGLFEGEGCIYQRQNHLISLTISSTDEDVMVRFQRIVGVGLLTYRRSRDPRRKDTWRVDINKQDEAVRVLRMFLPFLGTRRRAKALELLTARGEYIEDLTRDRACPECGVSFRPESKQGVTKGIVYCSVKCREQTAVKLRLQVRRQTGYASERKQPDREERS